MKEIILLLLVLALSGCANLQLGPRSIQPAEFSYNEAISQAWDAQLLLNLVRLRYRDNPLFVDVNSMTATYSIGGSTSLTASKSEGESLGLSASAGATFNHSPVISYNYLHGEQFAQRLLSPLSPSDLRVLAQSGWSVERLLLCCYRSVNDVENAIAAAGPTPDYVPDYQRFQRVATLVRQLQLSKRMEWQYDTEGHTFVMLHGAQRDSDVEELRTLLALDAGTDRFEIVPDRGARQTGQVAVMGRSLLAVMYFLSLSVEIPDTDRQAGKVTTTRDESGKEFEWSNVVGQLLRIHSGSSPPDVAAVKIAYRHHWFWIDDSDLNSKTTFSLLRLLLFLKSGDSQSVSPLVTIQAR